MYRPTIVECLAPHTSFLGQNPSCYYDVKDQWVQIRPIQHQRFLPSFLPVFSQVLGFLFRPRVLWYFFKDLRFFLWVFQSAFGFFSNLSEKMFFHWFSTKRKEIADNCVQEGIFVKKLTFWTKFLPIAETFDLGFSWIFVLAHLGFFYFFRVATLCNSEMNYYVTLGSSLLNG